MNLKRACVVLTFLLMSSAAYAREAGDLKGKILVYSFSNTSRDNSYGYYSYVIPDSIVTELRKAPTYEIQSMPVVMEYADSSMPEKEYKNYLKILADRGKEFNADFIISGSYTIEDRKIKIRTQIYDVNEQRIKDIHESSEELGALLLVIIDQLSEKINEELQKGLEVKKAKVAVSPFTPLYNSISGVTFGFSYGSADIIGDWGDIYERRADMVTLYLHYGLANMDAFRGSPIFRDASVSAEYDYASLSNEGGSGNQMNYLAIRGFTLNGLYSYRLSPMFSIDGKAGAGLAFSKIEVMMEGSGGPGEIIASETSIDPYLSLTLGAGFMLDHFRFSTGISLKRIFYTDTPMDMMVMFFGIGWTI